MAVPGSVLRVAVEFADTLRNGLPDPFALAPARWLAARAPLPTA